MANITASMVKDLRDKTGAGMMDCKTALNETSGEMEAAIDWLRTKGLAKAAKKAGGTAADGLVGVTVADGRGVAIPQLEDPTRVPAKARVPAFGAAERYGLIWVALAEPRSTDESGLGR